MVEGKKIKWLGLHLAMVKVQVGVRQCEMHETSTQERSLRVNDVSLSHPLNYQDLCKRLAMLCNIKYKQHNHNSHKHFKTET